jgi:hypothetical protein
MNLESKEMSLSCEAHSDMDSTPQFSRLCLHSLCRDLLHSEPSTFLRGCSPQTDLPSAGCKPDISGAPLLLAEQLSPFATESYQICETGSPCFPGSLSLTPHLFKYFVCSGSQQLTRVCHHTDVSLFPEKHSPLDIC